MPVKPLISPRRALAYMPFDVALLAHLHGRVDEDFDEVVLADHVPAPRCASRGTG